MGIKGASPSLWIASPVYDGKRDGLARIKGMYAGDDTYIFVYRMKRASKKKCLRVGIRFRYGLN